MKIVKYVLYAIAALIVLGIGGFFYLGVQSQNGEAPGLTDGTLTACPESPNCVSSEAGTESEKRVDAFALEAWAELPSVIEQMGGVVTVQEDGYLAAEFTSSLFRFVDDTEFRRAGDVVHVRSGSRVGRSDAGVNAQRIADLRARLSSE
ncbi:MAG: DUF1499 domain-containing protein [Pseudomonadota bacterium]